MELIREFSRISKDDAPIAGGKGASLGEMTQAGIPVPPGFVVLAEVFEYFLEETDLDVEIDSILHKVNHQEMHTIEHASETIQKLVLEAKMPKDIAVEIQKEFKKLETQYVAIRSSATAEDSSSAAWAGQLDSFLNTIEKTLLANVQKCWASLFTPRAIFYRFEKGLHDQKISVAVVVQKMVNSEKSGIAFSVHPVTEDRNQLIIEAGWGLGEAIVSGQITPDSYVVEKEPRRIIDKNIVTQERGLYRVKNGGNEWKDIPEAKGKQQTLINQEILELSELVLKIENHYGFPQDIEWAWEKGKFYITQSRPITTLDNKTTDIEMGKRNYDPSDYIRMFAGQSFVYLLTDVFLGYYDSLGALSVQDDKSWMSFLPKASEAKTLQEGKELYTSPKLYEKYNREFHNYIQSSSKYFESVISKETIGVFDIEEFFKLASRHFYFYSQTEFFYTDLLDQKQMVLTVQEFDKLKMDGRSYLNKIIFEDKGYARSLLKKLSIQTKISDSDLLNYSISEIIELVRDGKRVEEGILKERHIFFASKNLTLFGEKSKPLVDKFLSVYREVSDVIIGTTANKGKARGKARVLIPDFKDFDKIAAAVNLMKKGEILVAETTSPEIIAACKKAAAIITNQGGMLSHAAIVSRELGIPCIVGTDKDVILNIKTGDMLEVDANNGIIKIIKI